SNVSLATQFFQQPARLPQGPPDCHANPLSDCGSHIGGTGRDPVSQFSGPIAGFLPWIEQAKEAPRPPPPLPAGGLPVCTGPDFKKRKNKNPTERLFSLSFFFSRLKQLIRWYMLFQPRTNGGAYVAFDPSFRGLLPRLDRSPGAQRLGAGSSEGCRPSLHQRQCRADR